MFRSLRRLFRLEIAGILICIASCAAVQAQNHSAPPGRGFYTGVFGGGGSSHINSIDQMGTVYYPEVMGGPLGVNAIGSSGSDGFGLFGTQIGHEWTSGAPEGSWGLLPAVEVEGMFLWGTSRANLDNSNVRLGEQQFSDSFPMDNFALLTNGVLSFQTRLTNFYPYLGAGLGTTYVRIRGANSLQLDPPEAGLNHFNANTNSSALAFSALVKAGFRVKLTDHLFLFTEYRYLYVGSTNQTFGSTQDPGHAPTSPWTVQLNDMSYHLGVGGIGFNF